MLYLGNTTNAQSTCDNIYGGDWYLVRHSYDQWHPATDNLAGTSVYGTFDNNPQALNTWSIEFSNILESDGSTLFMFSNGDCSEWIVTRNDQFNTEFGANMSRYIIASHYNDDYYAKWYNRGLTDSQDPSITWSNTWDSNTILYEENDSTNHQTRVNNSFFNVWISYVMSIYYIY